MNRDDRISDEAMALWQALFGEPPIVQADGAQILEVLVSSLPFPPYGAPDPAD